MSTVPAREFHGRDAELALIRGELERLSDGAEAVVVVEGAAGMGKSRLLAEIAAIARGLDVRVGSSAADPGETVVELAALLAALFDGIRRRCSTPVGSRLFTRSPSSGSGCCGTCSSCWNAPRSTRLS